MKNGDRFLMNQYGKELDKQMEEDMEDLIQEEQKTGRKIQPAYADQAIAPGWKVRHGGTIGGKWGD